MKTYFDSDASLDPLRNQTLAIIGYGNQGRAQALNLRDSGLSVIVGNLQDESAKQAEKDGFPVHSIPEAVERGDVLALLIPDEVQRKVYDDVIAKRLRPGQTLDFATGYNIHFGIIAPPKNIDVIMVAPRMMGAMVRSSFERGEGSPAFIAVAQDATGKALEKALAWSLGIGATRAGVVETTFAEEVELDLFQEQAFWPIILRNIVDTFEFLVEKGYPPEIVALEMYGTGEAAEIFGEMARAGLFKQMKLHSPTSRYGTLSGAQNLPFRDQLRPFMSQVLDQVRDGRFAQKWQKEQQAGYPVFKRLVAEAEAHPINEAEVRMRKLLKFKTE
ncbi:MAG: ketol-acid reductoisomerase [Acidobacteria bacterium]|nr:ketol-acid reductoisomerase [Acidobacteriota bacterium]